MSKPWAKALGPQNTYAVVTIMALLFTLPFVLAFDAKDFQAVYNQVGYFFDHKINTLFDKFMLLKVCLFVILDFFLMLMNDKC